VVNALNEVDSGAVTVVELASALSTTMRVVDPAEHRKTVSVSNLLVALAATTGLTNRRHRLYH
jgi:hypothetical protein